MAISCWFHSLGNTFCSTWHVFFPSSLLGYLLLAKAWLKGYLLSVAVAPPQGEVTALTRFHPGVCWSPFSTVMSCPVLLAICPLSLQICDLWLTEPSTQKFPWTVRWLCGWRNDQLLEEYVLGVHFLAKGLGCPWKQARWGVLYFVFMLFSVQTHFWLSLEGWPQGHWALGSWAWKQQVCDSWRTPGYPEHNNEAGKGWAAQQVDRNWREESERGHRLPEAFWLKPKQKLGFVTIKSILMHANWFQMFEFLQQTTETQCLRLPESRGADSPTVEYLPTPGSQSSLDNTDSVRNSRVRLGFGWREGRAPDSNHDVGVTSREPMAEEPEPPGLPVTAQGVPPIIGSRCDWCSLRPAGSNSWASVTCQIF